MSKLFKLVFIGFHFMDSLPGVVALRFLSSNKTQKSFPKRDARGITTPSHQLADLFGKSP